MIGCPMPSVVTINQPDVVALIEQAARAFSLFGAHPGSVRVTPGVDLTAPVLDDASDAESEREIRR